MYDSCTFHLPDAKSTALAGQSLSRTLYSFPVTIFLSGDLGSGKTTLLSGFAAALGIKEPLVSPTYALEQRYDMPGGKLIHLDLYRLSPAQARELVLSSEDEAPIRCIEWSERLGKNKLTKETKSIMIAMTSEGDGRRVAARFQDIPIPTQSEVRAWQQEVKLQPHIRSHCAAVAKIADVISGQIAARGIFVRRLALKRAAELHDLLRFIDFRKVTHPPEVINTPQEEETWNRLRKKYSGLRHEKAAAAFLQERGYLEIASIMEVHGLSLPSPERRTIEQKILFYADKRVALDRTVTLKERFEDFKMRYGKGNESHKTARWYEDALALEQELFPTGNIPFTSSKE